MTLDTLTALFGWTTLINFTLLAITTLALVTLHHPIRKIHARMFHIEASELNSLYFRYLAQFKILVLVFNLTPYIALRIVG